MRVRTLLLLAIAAREVFSFWTGHPYDFELWVRDGYWVAQGANPYGIINPAPGLSFVSNIGAGGNPTIAYLPFWPLLLAVLYKFYALLGSPTPYFYYFLIKQPIIVCDVLLGYYLYRYLQRRGSGMARSVLKIWIFSPFGILLSGVWGMFDAISILFVVLALNARPGTYRGVWEGLATFAKSIPVIYAIPISVGPRPARNLALAIGIPAIATLLVLLATGWSFSSFESTIHSTTVKNGLSLSIWETLFYLYNVGILPLSDLGIYGDIGYLWIPVVLVATFIAYRWFGFDTERGVVRSLLLITLAFLLFRGEVDTQYSLYLFALMLIDVAMWSPQRMRLFLAQLTLILLFVVTNDVLLIRFLSPVYPNALTIEANLISEFNNERTALLFAEAMAFVLLNVYYFYQLYKERGTRTEDALLMA